VSHCTTQIIPTQIIPLYHTVLHKSSLHKIAPCATPYYTNFHIVPILTTQITSCVTLYYTNHPYTNYPLCHTVLHKSSLHKLPLVSHCTTQIIPTQIIPLYHTVLHKSSLHKIYPCATPYYTNYPIVPILTTQIIPLCPRHHCTTACM